jgi:hypothetical protein
MKHRRIDCEDVWIELPQDGVQRHTYEYGNEPLCLVMEFLNYLNYLLLCHIVSFQTDELRVTKMKDQAIDLVQYIAFMSVRQVCLMVSLNVQGIYNVTILTLPNTKCDFQFAVDKVIEFAAFYAFR